MPDETPRITAAVNGPYLVSGDVPLVAREIVTTERGESVAWRVTATGGTKARYALCRCGQSSRKPFCDGTHNDVGFDGTDTAPTEARATRTKTYTGPGLELRDDRSICMHAGFCTDATTNAWKLVRNAGESAAVASRVIAMAERCPSGAITYAFAADESDNEPTLPVEIGVVADGPLWVTGGIPVETSAGETLEVRNRVTLCRCGTSATKPLCDGSHSGAGFTHRGLGG